MVFRKLTSIVTILLMTLFVAACTADETADVDNVTATPMVDETAIEESTDPEGAEEINDAMEEEATEAVDEEMATDDTPADEMSAADEAAAETNLTGTISGAVEKEIAMNASFTCQDNSDDTPATFEIVATDGVEQFYVSLPYGQEAGSYEMVGLADSSAVQGETYYIGYTSVDDVTYDTGTGQIVIEAMPTTPRELFIGSITAELSSPEDDSISISAAFNIETADFTFECE